MLVSSPTTLLSCFRSLLTSHQFKQLHYFYKEENKLNENSCILNIIFFLQPLSFDEDWQEEHKLSENISSSTISVRRSQPSNNPSKHLKLRSRERVVSKKVNLCLSRERRPYLGPTCTRKDVEQRYLEAKRILVDMTQRREAGPLKE